MDGSASAAAGQTGAAGAPPDASDVGSGGGGTIAASDGGDASAAGSDGVVDATDVTDSADAAETTDAGGMADTAVAALPSTKVDPTEGCGEDPGQAAGLTVMATIDTMGTKDPKCADTNCAPWAYTRQYFLTLPEGYFADKTRAFPLVVELTGCGGTGFNVYPLTSNPTDAGAASPNVANTVIRVGLTPPPNAIGHSLFTNIGCYDDREGDDSVEWRFYENLYDRLAAKLCFDRNRVFVAGTRNGATMANELACKYAGDRARPIRGVLANNSGLPTEPAQLPTCSREPMGGMWIQEVNDPGGTNLPFSSTKAAVARAMKVNGCTMGTGFDDALFESFPIGSLNSDTTCKKIVGCPALTPLVVCALPGSGGGAHDNVANPGFSTFITLFMNAPLLTP
jgi:poly(3-hydroxybutyrate) depolymerase